MIGSGMPISHSNKPRPNVMIPTPLRYVGEATASGGKSSSNGQEASYFSTL
jgi:hypothetical protein